MCPVRDMHTLSYILTMTAHQQQSHLLCSHAVGVFNKKNSAVAIRNVPKMP